MIIIVCLHAIAALAIYAVLQGYRRAAGTEEQVHIVRSRNSRSIKRWVKW